MYEDHFPQQEEEGRGGFGVLPFALGVGVGIIATVLFATYAEDHFTRVTRKTRQLGDHAGDLAKDVGAKVSDKASDLAQAAKNQVKKVTGHAQETIDGAKRHVGELVDSAHNS